MFDHVITPKDEQILVFKDIPETYHCPICKVEYYVDEPCPVHS
jgi:rubredoxin